MQQACIGREPLGGAGEIGMNLNLYGHAGKWLMIDLGIGFADDSMPGVEVVMPDPAFIEERRDALVGIVLTHAHEDHLGAVADLWPRLKALNLNAVIGTASWELVEPEEGKYDFALVDGLIRKARASGIRLVLIWFGSWKNGVSTSRWNFVSRESPNQMSPCSVCTTSCADHPPWRKGPRSRGRQSPWRSPP